jgi:hypothetical protein
MLAPKAVGTPCVQAMADLKVNQNFRLEGAEIGV